MVGGGWGSLWVSSGKTDPDEYSQGKIRGVRPTDRAREREEGMLLDWTPQSSCQVLGV